MGPEIEKGEVTPEAAEGSESDTNALLCVDVNHLELKWYRKNGKYTERIKRDGLGKDYVIGDYSWNRNNKNKPEVIEPDMNFYVNNKDLF